MLDVDCWQASSKVHLIGVQVRYLALPNKQLKVVPIGLFKCLGEAMDDLRDMLVTDLEEPDESEEPGEAHEDMDTEWTPSTANTRVTTKMGKKKKKKATLALAESLIASLAAFEFPVHRIIGMQSDGGGGMAGFYSLCIEAASKLNHKLRLPSNL